MSSPDLALFAQFCEENLLLENGSPFVLEPFQRTMLADYFAGTTETLILISKKNGKSTTVAALSLFHLLVTQDAECVVAAASRDQATIIYDQAAGFVRRSETLQAMVEPKRGYREIRSLHDSGRIRVLASDVDTADGVIPTLAFVDELHRHKSADLYGVFRDGLGPRHGRMITISTAGDDEMSPLGLMRAAAHKLTDQARDGQHLRAASPGDAYVMHEWALAPEQPRDDMSLVKLANPASWQTEEALARRFDSPSMMPWQWARFACGVWVRGEGSAIQPEEWDRLMEPGLKLGGRALYVGWDQGWKVDTTALVPFEWESDERRLVGGPVILEPPGGGEMLDERVVIAGLAELCQGRSEVTVVYDPNAGAQQMVQQLERGAHPEQASLNGVQLRFVEHTQDNAPIALADSRLMEAIRQGRLKHNGNKHLRAHALNAVEKPLPGEKFRFDRPKRGARVPIDALRALAMAHSVAMAEAAVPVPVPVRARFM